MKARVIVEHPGRLPVRRKCQLAELPRSSFYASRDRAESRRDRRNRYLLMFIREVYEQNHRVYGSRRIHAELQRRGIRCSLNRVARLMRRHHIVAVQHRQYRPTTDSGHSLPVAPNRLGREFRVARPGQVLVADITYIPTDEGWLYLATELDLWSHRIVGWALSSRLVQQLVLDALAMAVGRRRPEPGAIHHSDRGVQYACGAFQRALRRSGMVPSMSRKGDPYDNAVAESFFRMLKVELVYRRRFRTRSEAKAAIVEYIELFYNSRRRHSSLGYLSPNEFERQAGAA
ncbi:MAG: IS3 family transposase [candidate division WOR-3 bacterium]